jgi:hypothetical protein
MPTDLIEARDGVTFDLEDTTFCLATNRYDELELRSNGFLVRTVYPGDYVYGDWEVLEPGDTPSPGVVAVLVKRSTRYMAARAARGFIGQWNLHDGARPGNLRALLKSRGGRTNNAGHLYPGVSARLMSPPAGFQVFWREEDDRNRRQELIALALAARTLDRDTGPYSRTVDYDFSDTPNTRPDLHWFATLLLVPAEQAAFAGNMESAFWIGEELHVDPHRVEDANHLWNEINPASPGD